MTTSNTQTSNTQNTKKAVVLFGHGSRDPLWHLPIQAVAKRIKESSNATHVVCAYLELTEPSLPTAAAELAAAGMTHITIVPMFLGVGRHAREDLPAIVEDLKSKYPEITFVTQAAIGENPEVLDMLAKIAIADDTQNNA